MASSRQRRIAKWIALGVLVPTVLLCSYVSLFWAVCWYESRNSGRFALNPWSAVFEPLNRYCMSDLPGALEFNAASTWFLNDFTDSLSETYEWCKDIRQQMREQRDKNAQRNRSGQ
jgi:hypothetical protein